MASLIDNLREVLDRECEAYTELTALSRKKTPIIIKGDVTELQNLMDEEQLIAERLHHMEKERQNVMREIAKVLNTDVESLKLIDLVRVLEKRPVEQQKLALCHDRLKSIVQQMKQVNEHNQMLIEEELEMNQFELNILQAMTTAPETANYNKGAYNDGSHIGHMQGRFDAKQ